MVWLMDRQLYTPAEHEALVRLPGLLLEVGGSDKNQEADH